MPENNRKISEFPTENPPENSRYFVTADEGTANFKINYLQLSGAITDGMRELIATNITNISNNTIRSIGLTTPQYLTLATHSSLFAERVFTLGGGLAGTDGGADGNYTLKVDPYDPTSATADASDYVLIADADDAWSLKKVTAGSIADAGSPGLTSPLTTKGDLWGYSTDNTRIPVGKDGQVLFSDESISYGTAWGTAFISGASFSGYSKALSDKTLFALLLRYPLMSVKKNLRDFPIKQ